jgi:mannan endo-1,4-beta-mannosidase
MKKSKVTLLLIMVMLSYGQEKNKCVDANASEGARKLLGFLYSIQGKYTLTAQHNFIGAGSKYTDIVKELTGKTPIIWGSDFSFCYEGDSPRKFRHCGPLNLKEPGEMKMEDYKNQGDSSDYTMLTPETAREELVKNVIQKHKEGFIITLMWHACPPGYGDCCDGKKIWTLENRPSQEEWNKLTTEGTETNNAWKKQVDNIAGYLKQLQDAGVPVLWRPYHEMNGVWFWWCDKKGENGFKKLWIMMYDRYVNYHKLNNLVWVWNTNAPRDIPNDEAFPYEEFYPGGNYVDVLAADVYRNDWKQSHHDDLLKLADGKPVAIGECAPPPTKEILEKQKSWSWFMPWGNLIYWENGTDILKSIYTQDFILTKEDVTVEENGNYHVRK